MELRISDYYEPYPGQLKLHQSPAFETLFGGQAGPGKSWGLTWEAIMHGLRGGRGAIVGMFRRTFDELEQSVIKDLHDILAKLPVEIGTYNKAKHVFYMNNGAEIRFCHCQTNKDAEEYRSAHFTLECFDELTTFTEYQYVYITSRCRTTDMRIRAQVKSASNPTGVGHQWVKKRFVSPAPWGTLFWADMGRGAKSSRIFIPAKLSENTALLESDPTYYNRLLMLPADQRRALMDGDWDIYAGQAFPEWDTNLHVCEPFEIPKDWSIILGMDWGITEPFYIGWIAIEPSSPERYYLIDEWYGVQETMEGSFKGVGMAASDVARGVIEREGSHKVRPVYRVAPFDMWSTHEGEKGEADFFFAAGLPLVKAQRDRKAGKLLFHELLRPDPDTLRPRLKVFSTCRGFIRVFPELVVDDGKPDDVDTRQEDHPYDGIRYALMSRSLNRPASPEAAMRDRRAIERSYEVPVMI